MTKQQEIELLDKTIAAFGPQSYLGPWLAENRGAIVADITADLPLDRIVMPSEAMRLALELRAPGKAEHDAMIERARIAAKQMADAIENRVSEYRDNARRQLERIAANL